jgi:hypothetical protein
MSIGSVKKKLEERYRALHGRLFHPSLTLIPTQVSTPLKKADMHPKKVTVLKVTGVELVTLFNLRFSCNTAYLFYCNRLSNRIYFFCSKTVTVFIISNILISVNLL